MSARAPLLVSLARLPCLGWEDRGRNDALEKQSPPSRLDAFRSHLLVQAVDAEGHGAVKDVLDLQEAHGGRRGRRGRHPFLCLLLLLSRPVFSNAKVHERSVTRARARVLRSETLCVCV